MADLSDPARNAGSGYIFLFNILCAPAPLIILMVFLGLEALNGDLSFDGKVEGVQLLNVHEMVLLHYYQSFVAMLVFLASLSSGCGKELVPWTTLDKPWTKCTYFNSTLDKPGQA